MPKFASLLIAAALWPCIASAQVPPAYHATVLGRGTPVALNNRGQVAGVDIFSRATVWSRDGVASLLPGQAFAPTIHAINDAGSVVGSGLLTDPELGGSYYQPLIWRNGGSAQRLELPGDGGEATSINNHGEVAGFIAMSDSSPSSAGFLQRDSGTIYFQNFRPTDINDAAGLVGNGEHGIAVWRDGSLSDVPDGCCFFDEKINNDGWIVGTNYISHQATLWHDGQRTVLWDGIATGINNAGMVIGSSSRQMLWYQGQSHVLDELWHEPQWANWGLSSAAAINDKGEIVALAHNLGQDETLMVLLSPVPEPSGAILLMAGLAVLGSLRARTTVSSCPRPRRRAACIAL